MLVMVQPRRPERKRGALSICDVFPVSRSTEIRTYFVRHTKLPRHSCHSHECEPIDVTNLLFLLPPCHRQPTRFANASALSCNDEGPPSCSLFPISTAAAACYMCRPAVGAAVLASWSEAAGAACARFGPAGAPCIDVARRPSTRARSRKTQQRHPVAVEAGNNGCPSSLEGPVVVCRRSCGLCSS